MSNIPSPLPPLQTLRAFEATSRLGSFTHAARELNVTQGAVSRQVRYLENRLGVRLLVRLDRGVRLTAAGQQLADTVTEVLHKLADTTAELLDDVGRSTITVGVTSAIASLWLIPRLTGFRDHDPNLDIRVLASDTDPERQVVNADVVIEYSRRPPESANAIYLFDEQVFPVCSPSYFAGRSVPDNLSALLSETLLQLDDAHLDWMGWSEWLRALGGNKTKNTGRVVRINNYLALLQAAVAGQGIALGWQHLLEGFLTSGALVPLLPDHTASRGAFWLTSSWPITTDGPIDRLCQWLQTRPAPSLEHQQT
ncbi:LysR family transcriptional regulator [Salinisphaera sp. USBA-960]|uniref:LysR substrate-binding domain-containing protein n=1 Tax=Salinisphaera orenii TaxID=856731 RepID=UPI000DBE9CB8|nr:LysR family transcriptional regulator [Salifodinibacter halophilus]NNC25603.1 LysR family transcriptional regulator [Salifodinibacter halophilus]